MNAALRPLFLAETDERDWLISAGLPLQEAQSFAGGRLPGALHIPALLDLVRQCRLNAVPITRAVTLISGTGSHNATIAVRPKHAGAGTHVEVLSWKTRRRGSLHDSSLSADAVLHLAEMVVHLDTQGAILSASGIGYDTREAADQIALHKGEKWSVINASSPKFEAVKQAAQSYSLSGSSRNWAIHRLESQKEGGTTLAFVAEPPREVSATTNGDAASTPSPLGEELMPPLSSSVSRIIANARQMSGQLAGPLSPQYARYSQDIADSSDYLKLMLEDVSELGAVNSETIKIFKQGIDLVQIARKSAEMLRSPAQGKSIGLILPAPEQRVMAVGDARRAQQIVINLVNNAIKYSGSGSAVRLSAWADDSAAYLCVSDDGEGIAPNLLPRVFDAFERLGRSGDGGSGLGLFISRRLALAMNGDLTVESTVGKGSSFTLRLAKDRRSSLR